MLSGTDLKVGKKIIYNGQPHEITESAHLKVAMGKGMEKLALRNLITGNTLSNVTCREVDKFEEADVTSSSASYLYNDNTNWYFMNDTNFEQFELSKISL
jgi:elongation factor P